MSFSSPGFLFAFLPLMFLAYWALPAAARNGALIVGSLAFYSIDGGYVTGVLIVSIFFNHFLGKAIAGMAPGAGRRVSLWLGVVVNLAPLVYYKYWMFLLGAGHDLAALAGLHFHYVPAKLLLPPGISFFTFQGLSYLIDIERGEIAPARGIVDFGMYHTLFPQLIAGPIVRFVEVEDRVYRRPIALEDVEAGLLRFCFGLAKKMVIADALGAVADGAFALPPGQLSTIGAWMGALAYTLQIYFDFSGYSDMAIGLGAMLGFKFPENFDLPYRSLSITEFWRRWHMTLSRWFRDYVYLPLGGNRAGRLRTYFNLFAVFVLCGLWHGAAYTFLVWGLFHGGLLVLERLTGPARKWPVPLAWLATMGLVMLGWVMFRSPTLIAAGHFYAAMAGFAPNPDPSAALLLLTPQVLIVFVAGAVLSVTRFGRATMRRIEPDARPALALAQRVFALAAFLYSASLIAANGFNPFIYFRF